MISELSFSDASWVDLRFRFPVGFSEFEAIWKRDEMLAKFWNEQTRTR